MNLRRGRCLFRQAHTHLAGWLSSPNPVASSLLDPRHTGARRGQGPTCDTTWSLQLSCPLSTGPWQWGGGARLGREAPGSPLHIPAVPGSPAARRARLEKLSVSTSCPPGTGGGMVGSSPFQWPILGVPRLSRGGQWEAPVASPPGYSPPPSSALTLDTPLLGGAGSLPRHPHPHHLFALPGASSIRATPPLHPRTPRPRRPPISAPSPNPRQPRRAGASPPRCAAAAAFVPSQAPPASCLPAATAAWTRSPSIPAGPNPSPPVPAGPPNPPGVEAPGRAGQLVGGGRGRARHGAGVAESRRRAPLLAPP